MNSGFMAALIVMVILMAFTFIIIRMIAFSTGNRVRNYAVEQMQAYDLLIEKKSSELNNIREQLRAEKGKKTLNNCNQTGDSQVPEVFAPSFADYRSKTFFSDYSIIKKSFIKQEESVKKLIETLIQESQNDETYNLLVSLTSKLSIDNVYKISSLHSQEQLEVINDIITDKEKKVLDEFMIKQEEFCCIDFYQWLHVKKELIDPRILIKTSEIHDMDDYNSDLIRVELDHGLCEGFQLLQGNMLYDYGVRISELV